MSYQKRLLPLGSKFNKLKILGEVPTSEKCRRYVYCLCDCGSKKVIRWDQLKSGRVKSCGCLLSEKSENQIRKMVLTRRRKKEKIVFENYVGRKYGRLTIQSNYNHPKYKGTWFNVNCDCGKKLVVSLGKLKQKHTKSCGCIRRKHESIFVSEVDGEIISVDNKRQYHRILGKTKRELLHIHEAKKVFLLTGKQWNLEFIVHHIDGDKKNNRLSNLAVLQNNSSHRIQHGNMERAMYFFLVSNNLIDKFYEKNSNLRLISLANML